MWTLLFACTDSTDVTPGHTTPPPDTETTLPTTDTTPSGTTDTTTVVKTDDGKVHVGGLTFDDHLPKNLLVISLDTTRHDYIGRYAGTGDTPNLDAWLESAYVLDKHRSCSNWTAWSMTCVVSGRTPMENGFATWSYGDGGNVPNFPPGGYETLPRRLSNVLGWSTVLVTANSVFSTDTGVAEGFDKYVRVDWNPADVVADAALTEAQLVVGQADPWYLHVHFIDPHGDYCPPEDFYSLSGLPDLGITAADVCSGSYNDAPTFWYETSEWQGAFVDQLHELYRGELRYWDSVFGQMMTDLEATGALDDALVMFVTDHGQQFYERSPEGWAGHGHGIYLGSEENLSTAAFWAANLEPGAWDGWTIHQDLTQTLYTMYGLTPLTPITGEVVGTGAPDRAVRGINYWAWDPLLSVVQGDHQLVYSWTGGKYFYRLDQDPTGLTNVYDASDPDVQALWPEMSAFVDDLQADWPFLGEPDNEGP